MIQWFKSSYSGGDNNCVEVGRAPIPFAPTSPWRTASYSATESHCVEVADLKAGAAMRDTKNRELGLLTFPAPEWQAFLGAARRDLP
ncbi:DUF397 domain-containing protein [Nocardiopsis sp. NPDC055824]